MRSLVCCVVLVCLTSCGYVGPVQPPSPEIPTRINDMAMVERGDKIIVTFTTPPRTVDGVAVTKFSHIDLSVGSADKPPQDNKIISVEVPPSSDKEDPQPKPVEYSLDASSYIGELISASVRTAMKKSGHYSEWSKKAVIAVIPPLEKPVVSWQPSAAGIVLTWPQSAATQFQVQRQGPSDKQPVVIASVNENNYIDSSAAYDTDYRYIVTAKKSSAESLPSDAVTANFPDIYPPTVPSGLTALVGPDSIELAWQRSPENDLQGYDIYRSVNSGPFEKLGDLVNVPTFTDRSVEHGKTYSYKVSAIDKKGNLSSQSNAVEAQF